MEEVTEGLGDFDAHKCLVGLSAASQHNARRQRKVRFVFSGEYLVPSMTGSAFLVFHPRTLSFLYAPPYLFLGIYLPTQNKVERGTNIVKRA